MRRPPSLGALLSTHVSTQSGVCVLCVCVCVNQDLISPLSDPVQVMGASSVGGCSSPLEPLGSGSFP